MRSIKLVDGDISFDNLGKMEFVYDRDALIQSFVLKLRTLKGELFYNDDYGHIKLRGKQDENTILGYLKDALMDDSKVLDIKIVSFRRTAFGKYNIDAEIKLNDGDILELDFII